MTTILTLLKMFGAYSSERKVTADGHKLQLLNEVLKNATADDRKYSMAQETLCNFVAALNYRTS